MFQCTGVWALFEATTIMSNRHTKYADHFRRRQSFLARQFWKSDDEAPIVKHACPPAGPSKTQDSLIEPAGPPAGPSTTRGSIIEHPGQPAGPDTTHGSIIEHAGPPAGPDTVPASIIEPPAREGRVVVHDLPRTSSQPQSQNTIVDEASSEAPPSPAPTIPAEGSPAPKLCKRKRPILDSDSEDTTPRSGSIESVGSSTDGLVADSN